MPLSFTRLPIPLICFLCVTKRNFRHDLVGRLHRLAVAPSGGSASAYLYGTAVAGRIMVGPPRVPLNVAN